MKTLRILSRYNGTIFLAGAAGLLLVANGRNAMPWAAWLAPIGVMRYLRTTRGRYALAVAGLVLFLTWLFQCRGMVPLPFMGVVAVGAVYTIAGLLPYALDRWLHARVPQFRGSFVFPCAVVAVEFALCSFCPYGSWGAVAYSQYGDLPLLQLAAVTGVFGISFLVSWLAPVVNWGWEQQWTGPRVRRGFAVFVTVVAVVFAGGAARLIWSPSAGETVRIAGIAPDEFQLFPSGEAAGRYWSRQPLSDEEWKFVRSAQTRVQDQLLAKTEREARAGARLVMWSEAAAPVLRVDQPALIARAAAIARAQHIYLGLGIISYDRDQPRPVQNKFVLVGPEGRVLSEYWKARPVPGSEAMMTETNGNGIQVADTELGRIGSFICFDLDFPSLVRQAGRAGVDILLAPSSDWRDIDPIHSQMAIFRGIENGCTLVRAVGHGRSVATDACGRLLAQSDYFDDGDHVLVANLPTQGVRTAYARIGDGFAWLCVAALILVPFTSRGSRTDVGSEHRPKF